jgi:hypothetical protein
MEDTATRGLSRLERALLGAFVAAVVGFGVLVEWRTAFRSRRMGDLDCFLRAGWAVLVGVDLYDIKVENGWHYNYPPLYAIFMMPLADPPLGTDRTGYVPFPVAVAIFYLLNVVCAVLAAHLLSSALEQRADDPAYRQQPRSCRRWWALRVWPALVCLPPLGNSAMKGQVNLQILALLSAWIACQVAGRRLRAGFFLAIAISIKVIPVYLLVYPLWRRDGRALAGCGLGLALGLVALPLAVLGPQRLVAEYEHYGQVLFGPLLHLNDDKSRAKELLGVNATDAVGIKNVIHNWLYPERTRRPQEYLAAETWAYRILGVLMTLAVLGPLSRKRRAEIWTETHELAALVTLMVAFSPVSHVHYYCFCLPLVSSLLFRHWQWRHTLHTGPVLAVAFAWFLLTNSLPSLPGLEVLKDRCVPLFGALPLWTVAVVQLWRSSPPPVVEAVPVRLAA